MGSTNQTYKAWRTVKKVGQWSQNASRPLALRELPFLGTWVTCGMWQSATLLRHGFECLTPMTGMGVPLTVSKGGQPTALYLQLATVTVCSHWQGLQSWDSSIDSGDTQSEFESLFCQSLGGYLTSLCFSFFILKTGIKAPMSKVAGGLRMWSSQPAASDSVPTVSVITVPLCSLLLKSLSLPWSSIFYFKHSLHRGVNSLFCCWKWREA